MNTSHFQWVLLVGCVLALVWQQTEIGDLQESLAAQGIQTSTVIDTDASPQAHGDFQNKRDGHKGARLQALESRISFLENRSAGSQVRAASLDAGVAGESDDADNERDEPMPVAVNEALDTVLSYPAASERLRDLIRDEQTAAWEERRSERHERRRERVKEELEALNEMLELSGSDADTFNDYINAENTAIRSFWGQVRTGEISHQQARKATGMRRTETDNQIREFLDENKYISYESWRTEQTGRRNH